MASYHSSFTYLNSNSSAEGFAIGAFDADDGLTDTYLGMDQIYTDSYNGTHRHLYGTKYNSVATITITILKPDGSDLSVAENRRLLRWLTGSRRASWLDLYEADQLKYSFYCTTQNVEQYKLDARVIGLTITFESIHPWAWSAPQTFGYYVGEDIIKVDDDGVVYKENSVFNIDNSGVLYNDLSNQVPLGFLNNGMIYNGKENFETIDNQSDDLYTYTNLDITFNNAGINEGHSTTFTINNLTLGEETIVNNISPSEVIKISANQFITSNDDKRIFGDDFTGYKVIDGKKVKSEFVFPRLAPGYNDLVVGADGRGSIHFTYRYPIKIGDCAIDVENIKYNPMCEGEISGAISSTSGITTLGRKNIILIDKSTGLSYIVHISNSYLHITETTKSRNQYSYSFTDLTDKDTDYSPHEISIIKNRLYISTDVESEDISAREHNHIVLVDNVTNVPYKLCVNDDSLYFIEL